MSRFEFQPGDTLAVSGVSPRSRVIRVSTAAFTRGISHVAIISRGKGGELSWWESSDNTDTCDCITSKRITGVGCYSIVDRFIEEREKGNTVWRYRLTNPLTEVETERLDAWLRSQHGKPYDCKEAIRARIFGGGTLRRLLFRRKENNLRSLFCAELNYAALRWIGVFYGGVASDWAPAPFCRFLELTGVARPEWIQGPFQYWGRKVER